MVELLDDLFARAAAADEPPESNFIRKHALAMKGAGVDARGAAARLFSNPAGDYGSMVNERVGASNWESGAELGDTWAARNAFSYGRWVWRGAGVGWSAYWVSGAWVHRGCEPLLGEPLCSAQRVQLGRWVRVQGLAARAAGC